MWNLWHQSLVSSSAHLDSWLSSVFHPQASRPHWLTPHFGRGFKKSQLSGEISCPLLFPLGRNSRIYLLGSSKLKVVDHESYRLFNSSHYKSKGVQGHMAPLAHRQIVRNAKFNIQPLSISPWTWRCARAQAIGRWYSCFGSSAVV